MTTKTKKPFIRVDCKECKKANYHIAVSKGKTVEEKITAKKFCRWCKKHTMHEMKVK